MLLSDRDFKLEIDTGRINIDPYDPALIQPASIDVRLDRYFRVFDNHKYPHIDPAVEQPDLTRLVEVDPDTGAVQVVAYVVVDDVGTVVNPLTLEGQIHGGVAQGAGQALMEEVVYDRESGQLLTASFMEYALPRADTLPELVIGSNPVPTAANVLGAKGAGEAGTVGALPAVMNAVMDALAPLGVRHLDMPATPERVWRAIQEARTRA